MSDKVLISANVTVDLDAVTFASREKSGIVNYALAGDPNKFTAQGLSAKTLWNALQELSEPNYLYEKNQEKI